MDQRLLVPLNALEASLNTLVQSLTQTTTFTAAPKAARDLVAADGDLTNALITLKRHQDNYQEILRLRAEKEALQRKLKDTIFECARFKKELQNIHPSVLEDSEDEEEEARSHKPIDYEALVAFSLRIGKHNAIAVQEAERDSEQQSLEARKKLDDEKSKPYPLLNGSHAAEISAAAASADAETETEPAAAAASRSTNEALARLDAIRINRLWLRSQDTLPFPKNDVLRRGLLGKLHYQRENEGEDAADAEVEKLVRESELKNATVVRDLNREGSLEMDEAVPEATHGRRSSADKPAQQQARPQQLPPKPRQGVNLDLPEEDDSGDE